MVQGKTSSGFKSITYRIGLVYNLVYSRLYDLNKKFLTIAKLMKISKNNGHDFKILDLACGTGYLARFLHPGVDYEGWDLNNYFLNQFNKDRRKGKIKIKKITLKRKNVFDIKNYPDEKKDVIVFSSILHHVHPKHSELVEHAKKHAKKIIICEPYAIKPRDITAQHCTARVAMFFTKFLPERLFRIIDFFLTDNDGINSYENRDSWNYNEKGLIKWYRDLGINKTYSLKDECIGVWES